MHGQDIETRRIVRIVVVSETADDIDGPSGVAHSLFQDDTAAAGNRVVDRHIEPFLRERIDMVAGGGIVPDP